MLEIKNLSFSFGQKVIYDQLNMTFSKSSITGLIGKNGVGKTTLFRILTKVYRNQGGGVTFNGQAVTPNMISFLPTDPYFYPYMKGSEYLDIVANDPNELMKSKVFASQLDLPLDDLIDNYSTGMKKKIAFAAIFAQSRPIVILDEPYNGVDLESNEAIKYIIHHFAKDRVVILSSHILSTITDISDRIYHLQDANTVTSHPKETFEAFSMAMKTQMIDKFSDSE
jgi:ABC-2 type transport system ATP-binding protein